MAFDISVFDVDVLAKLDNLNPIGRRNALICQMDTHVGIYSEYILIALFTIDEIVRNKIGSSYFYYIEGDNSIQFLLKKSLGKNFDSIQFKNALLILDISKLIYRFTCAKKFNVKDDKINQLRLNSWGRYYLEINNVIEKYENEYQRIKKYFNQFFDQNISLYRQLFSALMDISDENTALINLINNQLDIRFLA